MSAFDEQDDGPVYCQELSTGSNLSGTVEISPTKIETLIYRFDEAFFIKSDDPVFVRTAQNKIVSLYGNSTTFPGEHSRVIAPIRTTYCQRIVSSTAVSGCDHWTTRDLVKRASCTVPHTHDLLRHTAKQLRLLDLNSAEDDDFKLFSERADDVTLTAWYRVRSSGGFSRAENIAPVLDIEFDTPQPVYSYLSALLCYVQFFSFCLAMPLSPENIKLSRRTREDELLAIHAGEHVEDHAAHYLFSPCNIDPPVHRSNASPLVARNDDELAALRASVVYWMKRRSVWFKAYDAMVASLSYRNEISSERMVAAWRWFEKIPTCAANDAFSPNDTDKIVEAAEAVALRFLKDRPNTPEDMRKGIASRLRGAVGKIKTEANPERFLRLVRLVQAVFGAELAPDRMVTDLDRAYSFRGRSVHGHFTAKDEEEERQFIRSIHAVEALCFMMTARGLPISDEGMMRLKNNPLLLTYFLSK